MDLPQDPIEWLLTGDPAVRWQVLRDLEGAPAEQWQAERQLILSQGWGAQFLALQAPDGSWGGGIYSPKWTSTTYTLLTLIALGIPPDHAPAQKAAALVVKRLLGARHDAAFMHSLAGCDLCVTGMNLQIAAYFGICDARVDAIVERLLAARMADMAWNCRMRIHQRPLPHHSSFHTTLNVLEGLREWLERTPAHALRNDVLNAEKGALELLLEHRLFKSDKTGEVIDHTFTLLSFPPRWHYNILRGLAYFARIRAPYDERLKDAIELLGHRRRADGTWPVQHKFTGMVFFNMEKAGGPSRWSTLQALRVLQWWQGVAAKLSG